MAGFSPQLQFIPLALPDIHLMAVWYVSVKQVGTGMAPHLSARVFDAHPSQHLSTAAWSLPTIMPIPPRRRSRVRKDMY